ncbi:MAG: recombinase family protein [Bacilli bacterium]|nr:recombinase family protein [Bacilli bacterium]MBR2891136.1 recombinase family protein [Bacilli bacterium]
MKRVAIYIRFPFDSDGGLNIEENLKEFASTKDDWIIEEVFLEKNCSVKRTDKTELNKLLNKCNNKEFDIVLVKGIYHITRETLKFIEIEKELLDSDVVIYSQELDSEVSIINSLNERNVEALLSFLTSKITEDVARNDRYNEMQLRLETIQKMRWIISEGIVEIKEQDYLIHAYEILNEVEKEAWEYINTGN